MFNTRNKKPKIGIEVIFFYDDNFHLGFLKNDHGNIDPHKWSWHSYIKGYDSINDLVEKWHPLPSPPSE